MPIDKFLELRDGFERSLWIKIAERVIQLRRTIDQNRAQMIANAVIKGFGGK